MKRNHIFLIFMAFMVSMVGNIAFGKTLFVDDDSLGGNGASWATAYQFLQDALTVAQAGDEVRVAKGIYRPDRNSASPNGSGDREASFVLFDGLTLRGGYAGLGGTDPNAWDVEMYETVLSGDLAGDDVLVADPCDLVEEPTRSENSANIIVIRYASDITLDGLTVRGGFADIGQREGVPQTEQGGGAYMFDCNNLAINHCRFIDNFANFAGGGILIDLCEDVTVNDCLFLNNAANSGGGLGISRSQGKVCRSRIEGNWAISGGGVAGGVNVIILDTLICNNKAQLGGGQGGR